MKKSVNLQDLFLNQVRREKTVITIYLVNGYQLKGNVKGFDNYTIVIESDGKQQLIYKHAVSTIMPSKTVDLNSTQKTE